MLPEMSMRAWYAGRALQGILASDPYKGVSPAEDRYKLTLIAEEAFAYADAMLAAEKKYKSVCYED